MPDLDVMINYGVVWCFSRGGPFYDYLNDLSHIVSVLIDTSKLARILSTCLS